MSRVQVDGLVIVTLFLGLIIILMAPDNPHCDKCCPNQAEVSK